MVKGAFDDIARTGHNHFRLLFSAAVYRLLEHLRPTGRDVAGLDRVLARHRFLSGYLESMAPTLPDDLTWEDASAWWDEEIDRWECLDPHVHLPLRALVAPGIIDPETRMALVLAGLVEEDSRFGPVFAELQPTVPDRRPCIELLGAILSTGRAEPLDSWETGRKLLDAALVTAPDRAAPQSEMVLQVAPELWSVLRGGSKPSLPAWCEHCGPDELPSFDDLIFPEPLLAQIRRLPAVVEAGQVSSIVVRGMGGSDRQRIVSAVAGALGRGVVFADGATTDGVALAHQLGPLCTALGSIPVLRYDLAPGENIEIPTLPGYSGLIAVIVGTEGGINGAAIEHCVTLTVPPALAAQRMRHWHAALDGAAPADVTVLADRFHLPARHIRTVASAAVATAALDDRATVTYHDIQAACRTLNRQVLDTLAARVESAGSWHNLIVGPLTGDQLDELEHRCRHRERILGRLGPAFGSSMGRGVRALFTGSSGTGKTLAATILGTELGMDVYRVDLSAVINKYVGETEKNLHQVLSQAEELDVILLIDEGDALLGNRTEVRSANDRFANLETNYLLQRLETYQGIVLVTSNAPDNIDNAFQRRMDVVVPFAQPGPSERFHIWQIHLPSDHRVGARFLDDIAGRCALTGGQIRNAALRATLLALAGPEPVGDDHVARAVAAEYGKAGAVSPLRAYGVAATDSAQSFLDALS